VLTLDDALRLLDAARTAATETGVPMAFAVMDAGGHLLALTRMDGAPWITADVAQGKAWTSAAYGSRALRRRRRWRRCPNFSASITAMTGGRFTPQTGAVPVYRDGVLLGRPGLAAAAPATRTRRPAPRPSRSGLQHHPRSSSAPPPADPLGGPPPQVGRSEAARCGHGIPSASYSITVRLEVRPTPASVGRLTTAVGHAGGAVTALDVTESHPDRIVVDVTCAASDQEHAGRLTEALRAVEGVAIRKVSDRTFLLHLGGKIEVRSKVPLRTRDDLSMAYTPGVARGLHGHRRAARRRPPPDDQAQHRGRRDRRLGGPRARQHRPRRLAAGHGGQGRAVQALRRHRRLADRARHPGRRRDRAHRPAHRPGLRRHQPRGHRRARAASRSRPGCASCSTSPCSTTTSTGRPSSCSPP
jgi:uncharacterized protein GlcG (DUF336 family)